MEMIKICTIVVAFMLALAFAAAPAMAQVYAGAGAGTIGGGGQGQFVGGGVSAGTGGTQSFSLGSGFMYSMTTVSPNEAKALQDQGVRTIVLPAGTMVHVTAQTGQPLSINTGQQQGVAPNTIVFGPGGFVGTGTFAGAGGGTIVGPGGTMQMYSFTGSPGQAHLITQQSGGTVDRVLVVFQ